MNDAGRYVTGHYINYTDYMSGRRPTRARRVLRVVHGKDLPKTTVFRRPISILYP